MDLLRVLIAALLSVGAVGGGFPAQAPPAPEVVPVSLVSLASVPRTIEPLPAPGIYSASPGTLIVVVPPAIDRGILGTRSDRGGSGHDFFRGGAIEAPMQLNPRKR